MGERLGRGHDEGSGRSDSEIVGGGGGGRGV